MPLIPAICPQCGAVLSVSNDNDTMKCSYCNTVFRTEKAVQNFNATYNITNHVNAQNIIFENEKKTSYVVEGKTNLKKSVKDLFEEKEKLQNRLSEDGVFNDLIDYYKSVIEYRIRDQIRRDLTIKKTDKEFTLNFSNRWLEGGAGIYDFIDPDPDETATKLNRARKKYLSGIVSGENVSISGGFISELRAVNRYFLDEKGKRVLDMMRKGLKDMNDDIEFYLSYYNSDYSLPCEITINQKSVLTGSALKTNEIKAKLKNYKPVLCIKHKVTVDISKYM